MVYWFLYSTTDGSLHGKPYHGTSQTFTNIPAGYAALGPIADTDATAIDADTYPSHYTVQNGALVKTVTDAQLLAEAQQKQIAQLRAGYTQTLAGGFHATIGTTQYTFGWSTDDKSNLNATQKAIDQAFIAFPIQYADIHGSPVTLNSQSDLNTIESTATKFFNAQHQQVLNLIGQVNSATTVAQVGAITWTPASY